MLILTIAMVTFTLSSGFLNELHVMNAMIRDLILGINLLIFDAWSIIGQELTKCTPW